MNQIAIDIPLLVGVLLFTLCVGIALGLGLVASMYLMDRRKDAPATTQKIKPKRLLSPRRYRKEAEKRAAKLATLLVSSGSITTPTRR